MSQYKVSLHYNISLFLSSRYRNRTLIWDKEERPTIIINRLVKKKTTGRLAEAFTKDKRSSTLGELMTAHLGRQWIEAIRESKVKEYETIMLPEDLKECLRATTIKEYETKP